MEHQTTDTRFGDIRIDTYDHEESEVSAVCVTIHANDLDLVQETRTHIRDDGSKFKVKEIVAFDGLGNEVQLRIFHEA